MNLFERDPRDETVDSLLVEFFEKEVPQEIRDLKFPTGSALRSTIPSPAANRKSPALPRRRFHRGRVAATFGTVAAACVVAFATFRENARQIPLLPSDNAPTEFSQVEPGVMRSTALSARLESQPVQERHVSRASYASKPGSDSRSHAVAAMAGSGLTSLLSPLSNGSHPPSHRPNAYGYEVTEGYEPIVARASSKRHLKLEQRAHVRTTSVSFFEPNSGSQVELQLPELEIEILAVNDGKR